MIRAMIFDLDGTLVQTEKLKALSYAQAAIALCPNELKEDEVIEAFKEVVGLPRREVAMALVDRFDLSRKAQARMADFGVRTPWQAFVQVRRAIYQDILADPDVIRRNRWPFNLALLEEARRANCKTALATMSRCSQAQHVLSILQLTDAFDFVATRDDVENGKPDPEIYILAAKELGLNPEECLVIEDSPSGVMAAQAAGMEVVAVATPFTKQRLHASGLLPDKNMVDKADQATNIVARVINEHNNKEV